MKTDAVAKVAGEIAETLQAESQVTTDRKTAVLLGDVVDKLLQALAPSGGSVEIPSPYQCTCGEYPKPGVTHRRYGEPCYVTEQPPAPASEPLERRERVAKIFAALPKLKDEYDEPPMDAAPASGDGPVSMLKSMLAEYEGREGFSLEKAALNAAIAALAARDGVWLPIESAPRDGANILMLIAGLDCPVIGSWCKQPNVRAWLFDSMNMLGGDIPTHWHPLPAAPKGEVSP